MRATGIVRRIDDLGRVVIPKEIRRSLKIREGDPLEIFVHDGNTVCFKKYSSLSELTNANEVATALAFTANCSVAIVDEEKVIAVANLPKRIGEKRISENLYEIIAERQEYSNTGNKIITLTEQSEYEVQYCVPIVNCGDSYGAIVVVRYGNNEAINSMKDCVRLSAKILSNQITE